MGRHVVGQDRVSLGPPLQHGFVIDAAQSDVLDPWRVDRGEPSPKAPKNGDGDIDLFGHDSAVFFGSGADNTLLTKLTDGVGKVVDVAFGSYQTGERCTGSNWPEKCLKHLNSVVSRYKEGTVGQFGNLTPDQEFSYPFANSNVHH